MDAEIPERVENGPRRVELFDEQALGDVEREEARCDAMRGDRLHDERRQLVGLDELPCGHVDGDTGEVRIVLPGGTVACCSADDCTLVPPCADPDIGLV